MNDQERAFIKSELKQLLASIQWSKEVDCLKELKQEILHFTRGDIPYGTLLNVNAKLLAQADKDTRHQVMTVWMAGFLWLYESLYMSVLILFAACLLRVGMTFSISIVKNMLFPWKRFQRSTVMPS